jgi:hypothetical protein
VFQFAQVRSFRDRVAMDQEDRRELIFVHGHGGTLPE